MIVVGIDCATAPKKVGIALAECNEGRCALVAVELGESQESLARSRKRRADRAPSLLLPVQKSRQPMRYVPPLSILFQILTP